MCGQRDLVDSPHKDDGLILWLMCPNCDLSTHGTVPKNTYDGVGPTQGRA